MAGTPTMQPLAPTPTTTEATDFDEVPKPVPKPFLTLCDDTEHELLMDRLKRNHGCDWVL